MSSMTPLRRQYLDIKKAYPHCIVFFRLGDFYETFDEDAEVAARELDITLTSRPWSKGKRAPMAGVPHHSVDAYVAKLIERGYHVAICDQVGEVTGRAIVEREVTRVVTPGTVIEPSLLVETRSNYLLALYPVGDAKRGEWYQAGLAYSDISTGEYAATQLTGEQVAVTVLEELARLGPREVLAPESWVKRGITLPEGMFITPLADYHFEGGEAARLLHEHFRVHTLDGYGLADKPYATCAAGALLAYLHQTQKGQVHQLTGIRLYSTDSFMVLDPFTRRNLELTETLRSRRTEGSLLGVLDHTVTAMGARLLRSWIGQPLLDLRRLNARLDAVQAFVDDTAMRAEMHAQLQQISDLERLTNRLLVGKAGPRDLLALRTTLQAVPQARTLVRGVDVLQTLVERMDACDELCGLVTHAIADDPPAVMGDRIGVIRAGHSEALDALMARSAHARDYINDLERTERQRTGIATLKVGYNKVFGYYIEVSKAQQHHVPSDYQRKQTLVNAERYITPEMKEYEAIVLGAEEEILALEGELYAALCQQLAAASERLLGTARALAHLDVFLSMAEAAARAGYVRPTLTDDDSLHVRVGRHPVVERTLPRGTRYVPNDTTFDETTRVHIITGPNMAGKSTYIRQVALIVLMAQIGSFVPAQDATIGLVDRIFARIGAQDEIHAGHSTFMVEMVETARLLTGSTPRSLLILDEVGRGTSTYDGLAIARSVVEYIHNHPKLGCRTLFATHYHELTELPNILPRARNHSMAVSERGEDIVFLHKVVPGGADRSYGVHVAQLAGLPRPVVERARELLHHFEQSAYKPNHPLTASKAAQRQPLLLADDTAPHPAVALLQSLKIDDLSPIEALTKLYELRRLATTDAPPANRA